MGIPVKTNDKEILLTAKNCPITEIDAVEAEAHFPGAMTERGVLTSEYADMSNDKTGEIPVRRKPKVSWAMFVIPGLVGT